MNKRKSKPTANEFAETALSRTLANTATMQLAEIHTLDAFCTPIEERFERLTRLGRKVLNAPIVAITAITDQTQWFKSVSGWHITEMPLEDSLCRRVVEKAKPVMVGNLLRHPAFATHPLVVNPPAFRYYCGVPLKNAHGTVIGTMCAIGRRPKKVEDSDAQSLLDLAALAERELLTVALHTAQSVLLSKLSIARRQALIDPLTQTWNRRGGMDLIKEALVQRDKRGKGLAVLVVDIDDFKNVNDSFGHAAGDAVLRMVARELLACTREGDAVCRCGGDEFFVVLADIAQDELIRITHRVQTRIRKKTVTVKGGRKAGVSVSIGHRHADAGEEATAEELLCAADSDLYDRKIRNRLRVDVV